jgi:hypothetical protein
MPPFVRNTTVAAILALVAAVIAGTKAVLKPEDTYQGYASKGSVYLALRNDTRTSGQYASALRA